MTLLWNHLYFTHLWSCPDITAKISTSSLCICEGYINPLVRSDNYLFNSVWLVRNKGGTEGPHPTGLRYQWCFWKVYVCFVPSNFLAVALNWWLTNLYDQFCWGAVTDYGVLLLTESHCFFKTKVTSSSSKTPNSQPYIIVIMTFLQTVAKEMENWKLESCVCVF